MAVFIGKGNLHKRLVLGGSKRMDPCIHLPNKSLPNTEALMRFCYTYYAGVLKPYHHLKAVSLNSLYEWTRQAEPTFHGQGRSWGVLLSRVSSWLKWQSHLFDELSNTPPVMTSSCNGTCILFFHSCLSGQQGVSLAFTRVLLQISGYSIAMIQVYACRNTD